MLKTDKKTNLFKVTAIAMAIASVPLSGYAAGLGKIAVYSALGQQLKAEIEVTATDDELSSLQTKLASVDAFRRADVEYNPMLSGLKFSRDTIMRNGHRYIQVTTDRPVNEPFINMLVEMSWASGRLVREYTFLLDPPGLAPATATVSPSAAPLAADAQSAKRGQVEPIAAESMAEVSPSTVLRQGAKLRQPLAATASETSAGANEKSYKVLSGDTLGKIAVQTRPEGVSLDQMLVALLRSNQQAFDGGNMNRLKAGKILAIPDTETISQVSASEAKKEVVAQAADFNAYRKRLASVADARASAGNDEQHVASGKITPRVEDNFPVPGGKDKLEVSRTKNAKGDDGDSAARVAALEADLLARDKALEEARSRTAELEQNLGKLKQLAELKSKTGADMQQQALAGQSAPAATSPVPAEISATAPAVADDAASMIDTQAPSTTAVTPEASVSPQRPKSPAKKAVIPPPEPESEPDFLEENSTLVLGGSGILALLLGWLGFSVWKRKKEKAASEKISGASDFSSHSSFGPSVSAASIASSSVSGHNPSQFSISSQGAGDSFVDALSQADTFLAFGRNEQAAEVLISALETEPERHALYLKLFGIYAEQDKTAEFATLAKRFHDQTAGEGADWEIARLMGASIDPGNVLYQFPSAKHGLSEAVSGGALLTEAASAGAAVSQASLDTDLNKVSEALAEGNLEHQDSPAIDTERLDFDLDFDPHAAALPVAEEKSAPSVTTSITSPEMSALDFDLDLDLPSEASVVGTETPVDSSMILGASSANAPLVIPPAEEAGNSIDFDFDLPMADMPPASAVVPNLELDTIDLDLDADLSAPTLGETAAEDTDNPEAATKLELAAAYEEMGDNAGAIELYQEALAEGGKTQQEFARTKLASLT
ncbi:MAG: FimV/HubP family polar landmark protein [Rugosibacter sp.]|nr:FimV/HubP family polar landmark protein [Rugosibacter sp.]